jgi:hypothetical protein
VLGLNTWLSAAFNNTDVDELIGIQSSSEACLFFIGVGHGNNSSLNTIMIDLLAKTSTS